MKTRVWSHLATLLAVLGVGAGCAQQGQTIRGQSPAGPIPFAQADMPTGPIVGPTGPIVGSAPGYGELKKSGHHDYKAFGQINNNNFGYEGGYYAGPNGYYSTKQAYTVGGHGGHGGCPHCQNGHRCPPSGCQHCGHGCPHHKTTYSYQWPQNLVYPSPQVPAGMVQYPYYTLRGPTDFFMK